MKINEIRLQFHIFVTKIEKKMTRDFVFLFLFLFFAVSSSDRDDRKVFWGKGLKMFDLGIFLLVEKFWQVFFLDSLI